MLEVENETIGRIMGVRSAERYVLTDSARKEVREVYGIRNTDFILVNDASIVAVDSEEVRKKINFLNHLTNVSRAHGFHLQQNDNLYIRRNGVQEFGEWIMGWDEEQEAYLLTNCDY